MSVECGMKSLVTATGTMAEPFETSEHLVKNKRFTMPLNFIKRGIVNLNYFELSTPTCFNE